MFVNELVINSVREQLSPKKTPKEAFKHTVTVTLLLLRLDLLGVLSRHSCLTRLSKEAFCL